jgi:hypothetical protein
MTKIIRLNLQLLFMSKQAVERKCRNYVIKMQVSSITAAAEIFYVMYSY